MKGMSKLLEWQTCHIFCQKQQYNLQKYILLQIIIILTMENITQ